MHEIEHLAADDLGARHARHPLARRRHEPHPPIGADQRDPVRAVLDQAAEALLALAQPLRGAAGVAHQGGALERRAHRRAEAREAILDEVVGRAEAHRLDRELLADRAGQQDERDVRRHLLRDAQRADAVETGQGVIGEDQVGAFGERGAEIGLGLDAHSLNLESAAFELVQREFRIGSAVLHQEHAQNARPACLRGGHVLARRAAVARGANAGAAGPGTVVRFAAKCVGIGPEVWLSSARAVPARAVRLRYCAGGAREGKENAPAAGRRSPGEASRGRPGGGS
ncbi:MAG: hypothetical protein M5U08_01720 [Burkholderiales bacterium]|nr:hypothetical protein [Burkholderiales bacterium]